MLGEGLGDSLPLSRREPVLQALGQPGSLLTPFQQEKSSFPILIHQP